MKKKEYDKSVERIAEINRQARIHQHMVFETCVRCLSHEKPIIQEKGVIMNYKRKIPRRKIKCDMCTDARVGNQYKNKRVQDKRNLESMKSQMQA